MVTNLKNLKAANTEDVKAFIDEQGRKWTITNIEKEFWADAFRMAERLADAEDDETCEGVVEIYRCDDAEEVQDVSNYN
jgi:hypothetical protein